MATEPLRVDEATFTKMFEDSALSGVFVVQLEGVEIPVRVLRRNSPVLIVTFAGAVDRSRLQLPQFGGTNVGPHVSASVIGIADPSLACSPKLTAAWYAGHEGFETQQILPGFVQRLTAACEAERVIFVGGSAGGFAALYYAWNHPGSIALTTNPQTDIERYSINHQNNYRRHCRPGLGEDVPLSRVMTSSVVSCYAKGFENTVIYLQTSADPHHVQAHFAPFVRAVNQAHQKQLLARLAYWGREGHAAVPTHIWLDWLSAAINAPTASAEDIQAARLEYVPPAPDPVLREELKRLREDHRLAAVIVEQARAAEASSATSSAGGAE